MSGSRDAVITGQISISAYPTDGESLAAITGKFKRIGRIMFNNEGGFLTQYDKVNNKLMVYATADTVPGTRVEVADTTNLSATPGAFHFVATGLV